MMSRRRSPGLNDKHRKVLAVMDQFQQANGYPPSIREIKDAAGMSSTSVVNYYLNQLAEMGYIQRDQHVSRGTRITNPSTAAPAAARQAAQSLRQAVDDMLHVPVVGRIFASNPVPVPASDFNYMDSEHMIDVARSMLPAREKGDGLFALEVAGDSMIDAMINEGDIVIMRPTRDARNGEMVAVWLDDRDETTLKYFYRENGRIRLQPANPLMKPIYVDNPAAVQIQGKVVMVVRRVETMVG
ncbi:MAG: transcriptional repressor LexA [Chloroflexota bacterium]